MPCVVAIGQGNLCQPDAGCRLWQMEICTNNTVSSAVWLSSLYPIVPCLINRSLLRVEILPVEGTIAGPIIRRGASS